MMRAIVNRPDLRLFSSLILCAWAGHIAQAQSTVATDTVEKVTGDTYPIPEEATTFEDLMTFVEKIDGDKPADETEQQMIARKRKVARTVVAVSNRAMAMELKPREAMESAYFKLQALRILNELGEAKADKALATAIEKFLTDSRPDVQAVGMKFYVESGFMQWGIWDEQEKTTLVQRIVKHLKQGEVNGGHLQMLLTVVDFLGDMDGDNYAKQMLAELVPHFKNSTDQQVQAMVEILEGIERRLNLMGNKMELSGTLLDGTPLDWESYRGKVVLVDFWAIGCKPCRAELPNILEQYQAYHDKGFEVIGVNLDSAREPVEKFLEESEIPWGNLFSENSERNGWYHPMADYYGVTGIPRAILVDRDGTVVSMNARGKVLPRELRRLLGEPLALAPLINDALLQPVTSQAQVP